MTARDVTGLALDQHAGRLAELPGVQGVGTDAAGLVVYVDDEASVTDDFPTEVTVEVTLPVAVRVIGVVGPE